MRSQVTTLILGGMLACGCGPESAGRVLSIDSISDGGKVQDLKSSNGTDSAVIFLQPGYQKVLIHLEQPAGIAIAGADGQEALPTGAVALADSSGSYVPLLETEPGTIAAEVQSGYYWVTTTERDPLTIHMGAKASLSSSGQYLTQTGLGTLQQPLSTGGRWASFMGKGLRYVLRKTARNIGCKAAMAIIESSEGIKCQNLPVPIVGDTECFKAMFGCVVPLSPY